jgi:hypothetical protein
MGAQMLRMYKIFLALLALTCSGLCIASPLCSRISGEDAHAPLTVADGVFCFKLQPDLNNEGDLEVQIYFYSAQRKRQATKIKDWSTTGKIVVFTLDINKNGQDDIIVINSEEIRTYTGSCMVSPLYSISVFRKTKSGYEYDRRASMWFGAGADLVKGTGRDDCEDNKLIYTYPYKTKDAIEKALATSPFVDFIVNDTPKPATIIRKSWLYESSTVAEETKKYLIAGDKVMLDSVRANLCQITYTGGKKPLQMWIMCDALEVDTEWKP